MRAPTYIVKIMEKLWREKGNDYAEFVIGRDANNERYRISVSDFVFSFEIVPKEEGYLTPQIAWWDTMSDPTGIFDFAQAVAHHLNARGVVPYYKTKRFIESTHRKHMKEKMKHKMVEVSNICRDLIYEGYGAYGVQVNWDGEVQEAEIEYGTDCDDENIAYWTLECNGVHIAYDDAKTGQLSKQFIEDVARFMVLDN